MANAKTIIDKWILSLYSKSLMKMILLGLTWTALCAFNFDNMRIVQCEVKSMLVESKATEAEQARNAVLNLLSWYKNNIGAASRIQLVNQKEGTPYSVNFKNGERYLTFLKSSNRLTDSYLNEWRKYFGERDAGFKFTGQKEGPPTGFEYDLVMLSQEVDLQLASLDSIKIDAVKVSNNKATVHCTLLDSYEFRLIKRNNRWMINEILNWSQE